MEGTTEHADKKKNRANGQILVRDVQTETLNKRPRLCVLAIPLGPISPGARVFAVFSKPSIFLLSLDEPGDCTQVPVST